MLDNCTCPHCGADLPADAPEGLCPACLLNQAMKTDVGAFDGPLHGANTEPLWFYVSNKQKVGPVPLAQLQQLATSGELRPTDMLLPHGAARWGTAATVLVYFRVESRSETRCPRFSPRRICRWKHRSELVATESCAFWAKAASASSIWPKTTNCTGPSPIKVPHRQRIAKPEDADAYLNEARTVASLDHPHIVPVFDVGRTEDGLCFVVSKFIQGSDLAQQTEGSPPPFHGVGGPARRDCRGAASRPLPTAGPPGHQAGQHPDRHQRQAVSGGFWAGAEEGEVGKEGTGCRNTCLYVARTGARGMASSGWTLRHLQSGRRPL